MKTTGTTQVKRCLTTLLAVLMLISLIPMASVSVSATTTVTYAESFSALTNDQIVNGSTVTMANGATLTFAKSSLGTHTLGVEGGILKATSIGTADSSNYGWSVTYTLPEAVYGDVIVDFDWRMGRELADGSIVAMGTNGDHYSTKQVEIYDDSETAKLITVWDFHKTDRAYVNGRDNQPTCVICDTQMAKWSGNVTANFSYSEMKTLRTIIDTTEKTVEGGSLDDGGNYVHRQNQFGHSGAHNVVLTQLTDDCGGVKSIKFDMWGDGGVGDGVKTVVWLDNIVVSNSPAATTAETPVRFYKESFSSLAASDITAGNTVTMPNGATLKFANTNTSGATLTLAGGALKATSNADDKGWTMTYTLPKAVYGSVIVDFDFRMGIISGEEEVALSQGGHYSNNRFLINDENGNKMSAWGFNRTANAFINNRDQNPAQSCQTCETQLTNASWAATTTFAHDTMTTLRAILDTDADTVEGGSVNADGTYVYNTTRSGHTAAHNVVLPQLTTGCGGVKSITFNLYSQGSAGGTVYMYLDNITVTNASASDLSGIFVTSARATDGAGTALRSFSANQVVYVDAEYANGGNTALNGALLCMAVYNSSDELIAVAVAEENIAVGEVKPMSVVFKMPPTLGSGAYIKLFAWKSLSAMNPLEGAVTIGK